MRSSSLILLWCAAISGQPARPARELALTTTVNAGAITIRLHNEYSAAATAWIVACQSDESSGSDWTAQWHWSDQELGLEGTPLKPGAETEFKIPPRPTMMSKKQDESSASCQDYHVKAAVFADGTVSGDFHWIAAIAAERQKAFQDLGKAADMLKKAIAGGDERSAVVQKLSDWQATEGGRAGSASPRAGDANSWRTGRSPAPREIAPSVRPQASAVVPGAVLWLVRVKEKDPAEAVKVLAEWRGRLAPMGKVSGSTGFTMPPSTTRLRATGPPPPDLVGKPAPDFTLKDVDGREFALKDLRGKTVFLDFWATWCEPCRKDMPEIKALDEKYRDKGLVVALIDFSEPAETAKEYFEKEKYTFRNLLDPRSETFEKYGGGGIPKVVLIDKDGVVRYVQQGYSSRQDFPAEVAKLGL